MRSNIYKIFLVSVMTLLFQLASVNAAEITVFAAASLTDSLQEIAKSYEKESKDRILFNFGSSSMLARQIEEGAPADIFFAADEAKMDQLQQIGLVLKETRRSLLSNSLVIVTAIDGASITSPADLAATKIKRIALAEPSTVPAGIYAKKYLETQKLWAAVEPKVIPVQNVRAALAAVESGNVDAAIVYKTDAAISKKIRVAHQIPTSDTLSISYSVAVIRGTRNSNQAQQFIHFLQTPKTAEVFGRFGFVVLN